LNIRHNPAERLFHTKNKTSEFIVDDTQIKVGSSEYVWLWEDIESKTRNILGISIFKGRNNMFVVAERFLSNVIKEYGEHPVSKDGGTWYPSPQGMQQILEDKSSSSYSFLENSIIIERTIQY
jgi:transposase-like protein